MDPCGGIWSSPASVHGEPHCSRCRASDRLLQDVLRARVHYADPDFAAVRILGIELMLHADHTYEASPWAAELNRGTLRGLGAELRLLGMDPDGVAQRARLSDCLFKDVEVRGHGWREVMVQDPDGYVWAVGEPVSEGRH